MPDKRDLNRSRAGEAALAPVCEEFEVVLDRTGRLPVKTILSTDSPGVRTYLSAMSCGGRPDTPMVFLLISSARSLRSPMSFNDLATSLVRGPAHHPRMRSRFLESSDVIPSCFVNANAL